LPVHDRVWNLEDDEDFLKKSVAAAKFTRSVSHMMMVLVYRNHFGRPATTPASVTPAEIEEFAKEFGADSTK
jgi:hypothetical protein